MTVQVGYSAKTSERSERENAAEKQGQERHLGRTAISNKVQKRRGGTAMFEDYYMTADDVAKALKISKSFAYKVIRKMNAELQEQGFFTMAGKVNKQFFLDKTCYDAAKVKERK
jgi:hypothetical protein